MLYFYPSNLFYHLYLSIPLKEQTCLAKKGLGSKSRLNTRIFCRLVSDLFAENIGEMFADMSVLILAIKKSHISGTGGGPPTQDFTTAEELALDLNKGKPVIEGIQGGTATDSGPARDTGLFIQGTLLPYYCTWKILKSIYILCGLCDFALPCSGWQHPYTFGATRL